MLVIERCKYRTLLNVCSYIEELRVLLCGVCSMTIIRLFAATFRRFGSDGASSFAFAALHPSTSLKLLLLLPRGTFVSWGMADSWWLESTQEQEGNGKVARARD